MATASGSMNELASRTKPIKNTAAVYSYHPKGQGFFSNLSDGQSYFWRIRPHADRLPVQFAWRNAMRVFDLFSMNSRLVTLKGPAMDVPLWATRLTSGLVSKTKRRAV